MTVLTLVMNNWDRKSLAKCLKLLKSVLDPIMEIVQLMHGFIVVFTTFDKCVTKRSQEENALKTAKRGKLVLLTWTPTMFNFILVVILIFYRVNDCVKSGYDFEQFRFGKPCKMLEVAQECLRSINGNCATDAEIFRGISHLQQMCDHEKSGGCTENHKER